MTNARVGLGARITELRQLRGWTQVELAERLGITQATLARWETGDIDPPSSRLIEVASALGVAVTELFVAPLQ